MTTVVQICNDALGHLGEDGLVVSIDPPEGSVEAERCAQFYPIARDALLEAHAWAFATVRAELALLSDSRDGWSYAYAAPADMLHPQTVLPPGWNRDSDPVQYTVETADDGSKIILTDAPSAMLRYTRLVTDVSKFSPLFVDALGWLLASKLAGPLIKGDAGRAAGIDCFKMHMAVLGSAAQRDASGQRVNLVPTPDWIAARS